MKVVLVVVGIVVVALLCGGVFLSGLFPGATPAPQTSVESSPLQPLPAQAPETADMTVTLSERYFNTQLAQGLPQGGQVANAQIDLHANNQANVTATIQLNSAVRLTPDAAVQLNVQNGRIVFDVTKVDVGGFGVPNSLIEPQIAQLKQTAENQLNTQLAELERSMGLTLESMSTTENSLTLFFVE